MSAKFTTSRAVTLNAWGTSITVPAGTRLSSIKNGLGTDYAVDDAPLLARLTGNTHDPKYRYLFVPHDTVQEVAVTSKTPQAKVPAAKIEVRPDDDANFYTLVQGNRWIGRIHLNGEFMVAKQREIMRVIAEALTSSGLKLERRP